MILELLYVDDKQRAFDEIYRAQKPDDQLSIYEPVNAVVPHFLATTHA